MFSIDTPYLAWLPHHLHTRTHSHWHRGTDTNKNTHSHTHTHTQSTWVSTAHSWRCYPFVQHCYPIFGVVTSPSAHTHTLTLSQRHKHKQKHTQAHTHTHAKHMGEYCTFLALLPFCSALIPHIWRGYLTICTHAHTHTGTEAETQTKTHTGTHTHTHAKHMGEYCTLLALLPFFCSALIPHIWRGYLTICTHTHTHTHTGTEAQTQTKTHTHTGTHTHTRKAHG